MLLKKQKIKLQLCRTMTEKRGSATLQNLFSRAQMYA
uniref:Uncharacterized protein n=1 Tax=Anguilla anguilla TaxID=7936 RepID=A0A0E9SZ18_ANGAN